MGRKFLICYLILSMIIFPCEKRIEAKKQSLSFQTKSISLYEGEKKTCKVNKTKKKEKYVFSSMNKRKATVNSKGRITAKKAGITRIRVAIKGTKKKAYCKVRIGKYVESIKLLSANSIILKKNQTSQIRAVILPKAVLKTGITYRVLTPTVASVSKAGVLTAKKEGTSKIEISSVGVTKEKKRHKVVVTVHVLKEGDNQLSQTPFIPPSYLLEGKVKNIVPPSKTQLVAATFVISDSKNKSTLYFLNKAYTGTVSITLNGKSTNQNSSVTGILATLEKEYGAMINTAGTIQVGRKTGEDWWTISDLELLKTYKLRAWTSDTLYGSPYGLIIMRGDTTNECKID